MGHVKMDSKDQSLFSEPHQTAEYTVNAEKSSMLEATRGNAVLMNCGAYIILDIQVLTFYFIKINMDACRYRLIGNNEVHPQDGDLLQTLAK